jgi:chromosome segregation ATPase
MTTADRREKISDLRDSVAEINDDLESALDEMKELKAKIEALKEQKAWRLGVIKFLKAGGEIVSNKEKSTCA